MNTLSTTTAIADASVSQPVSQAERILFGLLDSHVLLWFGDILYFYGVIGMLAFLFRKMKPGYLPVLRPPTNGNDAGRCGSIFL